MACYLLEPQQYAALSALFDPLDYQLAVRAVLAGAAPGRVYSDHPERPRSAMIQVQHRYYLAGDPGNDLFNEALHRLFVDQIYPQAMAAGEEAFTLYFCDGWEHVIPGTVLAGLDPIAGERVYYERNRPGGIQTAVIPAELRLVEVERALTEDQSMRNLDDLLEEMQSERESIEAFLLNSFGVCLRSSDLLVTWCLSEYNLGDRCEIGIATHPEYRRRGLATATGNAFVELAQARGITRIGWHCWANNQGSRSSAMTIGCQEVRSYPSYLAFFDRSLNLAVHGNILLGQGAYREAQAWFARAEASGSAPAWAYFAGACAAARVGDAPQAFRLLEQAVAGGFNNRPNFEENDHLASLHTMPEWQSLLRRLA